MSRFVVASKAVGMENQFVRALSFLLVENIVDEFEEALIAVATSNNLQSDPTQIAFVGDFR